MKTKDIIKKIFIIIIFFIFLSFILRKPQILYEGDLEKDGFCIIKNALSHSDLNIIENNLREDKVVDTKKYIINNFNINNKIKSKLNQNNNIVKKYNFQDYIWLIKKSKVHTCHRDNNGSFFNKQQKYESYTIIFYLTDMEKNLDVIKGSHKNRLQSSIFLTDPTVSIKCNRGDAILFNANLVHSGSLLKSENNPRIQMKYTHEDDLKHLEYYENFNKILNKNNSVPYFVQQIQKHMTCQIPLISDLTQKENIRTSRGSSEVDIGNFQKIYSSLFYGDKDFYDIPNAK